MSAWVELTKASPELRRYGAHFEPALVDEKMGWGGRVYLVDYLPTAEMRRERRAENAALERRIEQEKTERERVTQETKRRNKPPRDPGEPIGDYVARLREHYGRT